MDENLDLAEIIRELEDFFEIKAPDYKIEIAKSREEFNELTNRDKTEPWMAGWSNGYRIVVIHPNKLEELTNGIHKRDSHPKRVKHELAHIFYKKVTGGERRPTWLNEGLAFYLDGRGGTPPKSNENKYEAIKYFDNFDSHIYQPSSFMVKTLLDKFGKIKMLKLIKSIRPGLSEDDFKKMFHNVYGFSFTEEDLKKIVDNKRVRKILDGINISCHINATGYVRPQNTTR